MHAGTFAWSAEGSFVGQSPSALPSPCTDMKAAEIAMPYSRHVQAFTHTNPKHIRFDRLCVVYMVLCRFGVVVVFPEIPGAAAKPYVNQDP